MAEMLKHLKVGNIVAVINQHGALIKFTSIKRVTDLGVSADGHFFDFTGLSHTGEIRIRCASEMETIIHQIKSTSGLVWARLGMEKLLEIHQSLKDSKNPKDV